MHQWHLIYTKPKQEEVALHHLLNQNFKAYLPLIKREKILRGKKVIVSEPWFSRYLFISLNNDGSLNWSPIRSSRGVSHKVKFGNQDATLPDDLIDTLQASANQDPIKAVIDFAGLKAVGVLIEKPLEYFDNNVGGTISLLHAMQDNQVKTLVFSSSATVYGEPQYFPIDENHPISITNPYGRTKLYIKGMLSDLVLTDGSWGVICLRCFNPEAAHDSALIGENPSGTPNNLMPFFSQVAAGLRSKVYY